MGKSTLVRQTAAVLGLDLLEVNCEQNLQMDAVFKTLNMQKIVDEIESLSGKKTFGPKTLLFLDEVQATPNALAALRYFFEERPEIKVICAGSLLEFALTDQNISMPVGRIEFLHVVPMDFEEFIVACGEQKLYEVLQTFTLKNLLSVNQHNRLLELQQLYCFIGGMPEAVREYSEHRKLSVARIAQESILETYKSDFAKYGLRQDLLRLGQVLDHVAQRVTQRVKLANLLAGEQSRTIRRLLNLLIQARLLSTVDHTDANDIPLGAEVRPEVFKLLILDIGLLNGLLGLSWKELKKNDSVMTTRDGALAEQFVGQELIATFNNGKQSLYYWLRDGKSANAEIDFIISAEGVIVPIEVKAGKSGTLRSLRTFCNLKHPKFAFRFDTNLPSVQKICFDKPHPTPGKAEKDWELISLPIYASCQLSRFCSEYG